MRRGLVAGVQTALAWMTLMLSASVLAADDSPIGVWLTIDDNSGRARSEVRITEQNGALFGRSQTWQRIGR